MLRVLSASGEEVATRHADELRDVVALKQELQRLCGVPRFRQRLLHNSIHLEDDATLSCPMDVQLVLLHFVNSSQEEVDVCTEAASNGDAQVVLNILQRPQDPDLVDQEGDTALFRAALQGHSEIVRLLLEAHADADTACRHGSTPLFEACDFGHVETVQLLLDARADVQRVDPLTDSTAILCASEQGHEEILHLLLRARANVEQACHGRTALHAACEEGQAEIANMLLDAAADPDAADSTGQTPLDRASRAGHSNIVLMLQKASHVLCAAMVDMKA